MMCLTLILLICINTLQYLVFSDSLFSCLLALPFQCSPTWNVLLFVSTRFNTCQYIYQHVSIHCAGWPKCNILLSLSTRFATLCARASKYFQFSNTQPKHSKHTNVHVTSVAKYYNEQKLFEHYKIGAKTNSNMELMSWIGYDTWAVNITSIGNRIVCSRYPS